MALPYLGLLPIGIGLWDAGNLRKYRHHDDTGEQAETEHGGPAARW